MSASSLRRGACPTLFDPMETGDGLLARLVPARGAFAPAELAGLASASARHGNGLLEVTARGSLQVRGLSADSADRLAAEIADLGIAVRTGVPVETGPLAGLDPTETADGSALVAALARRAAEAGFAERLGPKVSVVVDGGGAVPLAGSLADIRLDAAEGGLWRLALAGTRATATALTLLEADEAQARAFALLGALAGLGRRARGRDLLARTAPAAGAPGPRPAGETRREPLPVGTIPLCGGRAAVRLACAFGQVSASVVEALALGAAELGLDEIRLSPDRAFLLLGDVDLAGPSQALGARLRFVFDRTDPRLRVSACAGQPACASAHLDTKRLAAEIAARLPPGEGRVHLSGCAKRCAEPAVEVRAAAAHDGRVALEQDAPAEAGDAASAVLARLRSLSPSRRGRAA